MSKDKVDLWKLREEDKKKPKYEPTEEELQLIKEQESVGRIMDTMQKRELFLQKNKEKFNNDDSLLLYRLPLNSEQMKIVYNNIVKNNIEM